MHFCNLRETSADGLKRQEIVSVIAVVMRTKLDVDEKSAAKLRELAAAGGVSVDQVLATYVPGLGPTEVSGNGATDPLPAFEEWADSFNEETPNVRLRPGPSHGNRRHGALMDTIVNAQRPSPLRLR